MSFIDQMVIYLLLGVIWGWWLESFTVRNKIGPKWTNIERIYQLTTWPYNFFIFVYTWIKEGFFDDED